jgi:hypothetical protein
MNQIKPKSNQNSSMKFMLAVLVLIEIFCVGQAVLLAERQIVTCPLQFFLFFLKVTGQKVAYIFIVYPVLYMEHSSSQKLTVCLAIRKFPTFYGIRRSITMFRRAHHQFLS